MTDSLREDKQHLNSRQLQQLWRMYQPGENFIECLAFDRGDVDMLKMTVAWEEAILLVKIAFSWLVYMVYMSGLSRV